MSANNCRTFPASCTLARPPHTQTSYFHEQFARRAHVRPPNDGGSDGLGVERILITTAFRFAPRNSNRARFEPQSPLVRREFSFFFFLSRERRTERDAGGARTIVRSVGTDCFFAKLSRIAPVQFTDGAPSVRGHLVAGGRKYDVPTAESAGNRYREP